MSNNHTFIKKEAILGSLGLLGPSQPREELTVQLGWAQRLWSVLWILTSWLMFRSEPGEAPKTLVLLHDPRLHRPAAHHRHRSAVQRSGRASLILLCPSVTSSHPDCLFPLPVVRLESSLSNPVSLKLASNQLPQSGEELLQVLVQNSSRDSRTLRAQLGTLHTQVLL